MGPADRHRRDGEPGLSAFAVLFMLLITALAFAGRLPFVVPVTYLALSGAALAAYAVDKSAARAGRWRTRERNLHLLALLGGWPGAAVAQRVLRHKSQKRSFRRVFLGSVLANCTALAVLVWWTWRPG